MRCILWLPPACHALYNTIQYTHYKAMSLHSTHITMQYPLHATHITAPHSCTFQYNATHSHTHYRAIPLHRPHLTIQCPCTDHTYYNATPCTATHTLPSNTTAQCTGHTGHCCHWMVLRQWAGQLRARVLLYTIDVFNLHHNNHHHHQDWFWWGHQQKLSFPSRFTIAMCFNHNLQTTYHKSVKLPWHHNFNTLLVRDRVREIRMVKLVRLVRVVRVVMVVRVVRMVRVVRVEEHGSQGGGSGWWEFRVVRVIRATKNPSQAHCRHYTWFHWQR